MNGLAQISRRLTMTSASGEFQDIIGMLANTLALDQFPKAEKPFSAFLKEVKELSNRHLTLSHVPNGGTG